MLAIEYYVHTWQVLRSSAAVTTVKYECDSNNTTGEIENFTYGEIDERNFSNSHPWLTLGSRIIFGKIHFSYISNHSPRYMDGVIKFFPVDTQNTGDHLHHIVHNVTS